jgi:hypothetical protein
VSALALYLLGVVYTAAALIVYAYRTSPRPGLSLTRLGYVVVVVGAIGWFVFVPVALALHALALLDYVDLSIERLRVPAPKEEKPAHPQLKAGQLAILATVPPKLADDEQPQRPRHAALRPVVVKGSPDEPSAVEAAVEPAAVEPAEQPETFCPACKAPQPADERGFLPRHNRTDGPEPRYCPGSHARVSARP